MTPLPSPPDPRPPLTLEALDRLLDGEGGPEEQAAFEGLRAADPAFARRAAARASLLEALRGARWAPAGLPAGHLPALEARVRAALAGQARAGRRRLPALVAGALALAVGVGVWLGRSGGPAEAFDPVELAADLLAWKPKAFEPPASCASEKDGPLLAFPLVRSGELEVTGCVERVPAPGARAAVLRRPEQLPKVGYVAVPAGAGVAAGEVGITEVEDGRVIVFDVLDGSRHVYLAVDPRGLSERRGDAEGRWTCAACHGPARQAQRNPHRIVLRRAP